MTTKRNIERRLEALEAQTADVGDRPEMVADAWLWRGPEPELTDYLATRGFVIEREARHYENGYEDVLLHATPSAGNLRHQLLWHWDGPTAPLDDLRIVWEDTAHDAVLADVAHPVEYSRPGPPDESVTIEAGDGWQAVVPEDRVIDSLVLRRGGAERSPYEIRRPVELPIRNADEYDLVVVDADPGADRHPNI